MGTSHSRQHAVSQRIALKEVTHFGMSRAWICAISLEIHKTPFSKLSGWEWFHCRFPHFAFNFRSFSGGVVRARARSSSGRSRPEISAAMEKTFQMLWLRASFDANAPRSDSARTDLSIHSSDMALSGSMGHGYAGKWLVAGGGVGGTNASSSTISDD